jgi:hypothetical protein
VSNPPVLNLDKELQRSDLTYKGATYELRSRGELSLVEAQRLSTLLHSFDDVKKLTEDEEAAAKAGELLQSVAALLVVDAPPEGFPDQACAAILSFWGEQNPSEDPPSRPRREPRDRQPRKSQKKSTGAK